MEFKLSFDLLCYFSLYPKRPCGSGCMADLERRTVKCLHLAVDYHCFILAIVTAEANGPLPILRSQGDMRNWEPGRLYLIT